MPALTVGTRAPAFALPDARGNTIRLSAFTGKTVILYFYPKDDTPGCTKEACSFQEHHTALLKRKAVVLGVSADSPDSHGAFAAKYGLTFPLLSDGTKEVAKAYGVWKKKTMYGRTYYGIERTTFIIGPTGVITRIFPKVKVDGHTAEVLASL